MIGRRWRAPGAAILVHGGVALAASAMTFLALRLWRADLRVPFSYRRLVFRIDEAHLRLADDDR